MSNKLTFEEINKILKERFGDCHDLEEYFSYKQTDDILGRGESVDSYGGEGEGKKYYNIYHFIDHDVYIKLKGYYSSYNGVDYDNWEDSVFQVKPVEKTITVYE